MKFFDPRYVISHFSGFVNPEKQIARKNIKLLLPFYHCISDFPGSHLKHLYAVKNIKEFIRDLDLLLKYYEPLSPDIFRIPLGKPEKPGFLLTFDDGLSEVYDVVAPVLERKGIPAIFFLNNNFIDNKDLFFRYKVSLIIEKLIRSDSFMNLKAGIEERMGRKVRNISSFKRYLLRLGYADKSRIDEFAGITEVDVRGYLDDQKPYMSTENIISLKNRGFHIGAHSYDHEEFFRMPSDMQVSMIKKSTEDICHRFDLDYGFFAFPFTDFGVSDLTYQNLFNNTEEVNAVFGTSGLVRPGKLPVFQRLSMEKYPGNSEEILRTELFYFHIKKMLGK